MEPRPVVAMLLCVGLAATPLRADGRQDAPPAAALCPGEYIRFETTTVGRRFATVVEMDGEALVVSLASRDQVVRVSLSEVESVDVLNGRRSRAQEGAIAGTISGALLGGLAGAVMDSYAKGDWTVGPYTALWAFLVSAVGALLGAAIGAASKTERWDRVQVSVPRASFQFGPTGKGGLAVGLKLSF